MLLIIIFITAVPKRQLSGIEKLYRELVAPLQKGLAIVSGSMVDTISYLKSLKHAAGEAEKLRDELVKAQFELEKAKEIALENQRLKELVGFKKEAESKLVPTRVIGRDPRAWLKTIVIDKGQNHNVRVGIPIVTYSGIVGHVTGTTRNTAQVTLLVDPKTTLGGIVQRTRDFVVIDNADPKGQLRVTPLYQKEDNNQTTSTVVDFQTGDLVVTSGFGGIYPKGLTIGTIIAVKQGSEGLVGTLSPSVDFRRLEEVFILFEQNVFSEEGRESPASQ